MDIALVGMGCLFPKAGSIDEFWRNIRQGIDGIGPIPATHWRPDDYFDADKKAADRTYARRGGFLSPYAFNPLDYGIAPNDLEATDTSQLLGMVVAQKALEDAGYGLKRDFDRSRVSCIIGVTGTLELVIPLGARLGHPIWKRALAQAGVDEATAADVMDRIQSSYVGWQESSFPGLLGNVVAGRIANRLNLGGTNCVVDAACASSLSALHLASMELVAGRSDMVVTGGVDTFNDIFMYMCFSKTPALSPSGDARPFANDSDGTILGEGLGAVILKRLSDAERDGDKIHAVLKGIGTSSDGKGQAIYAPSANGQARCLRAAYADAGVEPRQIELVEAHGTGTKVGDAVELTALREVFGGASAKPWCALGSVKSQIGHTKAAAGVAGVIKAALSIGRGVLPPTIKISTPADGVIGSPFYVARAARPWVRKDGQPRRAAVSAFGFGGSNFHCVLEEAPTSVARSASGAGEVFFQIIPYAGVDAEAIEKALTDDAAVASDWLAIRAVGARRRRDFAAAAAVRLVLVVQSSSDEPFAALVARAQQALRQGRDDSAKPNKILFGTGVAGELAALFPGQGAQSTGMLQELACEYEEMRLSLEAAERAAPGDERLVDIIYPPAAYDDSAKAAAETRLTRTEWAQPALGAVCSGALGVLRRYGVAPAASLGHSFGELTALFAAGIWDEQTLHRAASARGKAMAAAGEDLGTMLAVSAPKAQVAAAIASEHLAVTLANDNAPEQVVVAGTRAAIEAARAAFSRLKMASTPLNVGAAFHSPLVAPAAAPFAEFLRTEHFAAGHFPVLANATASAYPDDEADKRSLLAGQLASPVRFVEAVEALYARGCRLFLEVGPGARLSGLVRRILAGKSQVRIVALDGKGLGGGTLSLAAALAELAAAGVGVDLTRWDHGFHSLEAAPIARGKVLTVPIGGANYVKPERLVQKPARVIQKPTVLAPPAVIAPRASAPTAAPASVSKSVEVQKDATRPARPAPLREDRSMTQHHSGPAPELLQLTRDTVLVLQRMQEQSAALHQQFLEGQMQVQRMFFEILAQQRLGGSMPLQQAGSNLPASLSPFSSAPPPFAAAPVTAAPTAWTPPTTAAWTPPATSSAWVAAAAPAGLAQQALATPRPAPSPFAAGFAPTAPGSHTQGMTPAPRATPVIPTARSAPPQAPVAAPRQVPVAASAAVASAPASASSASLVLAVIAEKTGYPVDMLDLSMGLESDLGIDSIKRVEIFSDLTSRSTLAAQLQPEDLTRLATVGEIVAAIDALAGASAAPVSANAVLATAPVSAAADDIGAAVLAVVAEKTGYPSDMLTLEMNLESDLGIDSIKRVEIFSALTERLPAAKGVPPEILTQAHTLAEIVAAVSSGSAPAPAIDRYVLRAEATTAATGAARPAEPSPFF